MNTFSEQIVRGFSYAYEGSPLVSERSAFQRIEVYEHASFGRMLVLDGLVQTTERDEFVYHEMLAHVPLLMLEVPRNVLVIGGGDGGTLRRVLEHPSIERAAMVEIDARVTEVCRELMPSIASAAFDDPRADVRFDDGIAFVRDTGERFDVKLIDSSDPVGPGEGLFTPAFYESARRALAPGGLLVAQSGSPLFQQDELHRTFGNVRGVFTDARVYLAAVPTYPGALWSFTMAGDSIAPDAEVAAKRAAERGIVTRYWTPEVQTGAFAVPALVSDVISPDGPSHPFGMSPEEADVRRQIPRG